MKSKGVANHRHTTMLSTPSQELRHRHAKLMTSADSYIKGGNPEKAIGFLEEVVAENRDHLGAYELLAKSFWKLEKYSKVLEICKELIRLNPFDPGYFHLQAMSYRALGYYGECARILARHGNQRLLEDVEALQVHLIRDLLLSDAEFAKEYQQNAASCLDKYGFYFHNQEAARVWIAENVSAPKKNRTKSDFARA